MTTKQARRQDIVRLQIVRTLRSLGQGALLVTFALYLNDLGWSAGSIGLLLSVGGLVTAALSLPVGIASDRIGRKNFVIINEAVVVFAALLATLSSHTAIVAISSLLGAFGRGQVGMVGPALPAEQAWMAELTHPSERGRVYSNNAALGFLGMGIGSILAGMMPLWRGVFPGPLSYRPFFALVVVAGVINLMLLAGTRSGMAQTPELKSSDEPKSEDTSGQQILSQTQTTSSDEAAIRRRENGLILRLGAINAMNGLAIGLTAPLLSYWFFMKFGAGPQSLGPVFAVTYFATGVASVTTGRVAERIGLVRSVVSVRLMAVVLLLLLPVVPYFWLASLIHVIRSALNRGTAGTRQALTVSLVRDERRGFASSINAISMSLPNALGPLVAGLMLDAGHLTLPFLVAAAMQFGYGILFGQMFQSYDPTAKRSNTAA